MDGWARMSSLTKKTQEVGTQIWHLHQIDQQRDRHTDRHIFEISLKRRLVQSLPRKQQRAECVQWHIRHGQHSALSKILPNNGQCHFTAKTQVADHVFIYGQKGDLVFIEHKSNFRSALRDYESFLLPHFLFIVVHDACNTYRQYILPVLIG